MSSVRKAKASDLSVNEFSREACRGGGSRMSGADFAGLRASLGKSQRELAELLGISRRTVESYEQGGRIVPSYIERLLYFLRFRLNEEGSKTVDPCWKVRNCPEDLRSRCITYVAMKGHVCWFLTGRLCDSAKKGEAEGGCDTCDVFTKIRARVEGGEPRSHKGSARPKRERRAG